MKYVVTFSSPVPMLRGRVLVVEYDDILSAISEGNRAIKLYGVTARISTRKVSH